MGDSDLELTPSLRIPADELVITYARSPGPGGQNVNKVNTKVILRFSVRSSRCLSDDQRVRVLERVPPRYLTKDGDVVLHASEHRDQSRNREAALARLASILGEALRRPKARRRTRPTRAARARRLDLKARQSEKKRARGTGDPD
jgi:ribosome-associated protein